MILLLAGLSLFIGVHSISLVNETWRNHGAQRFGEQLWKAVYSVIALAGLVMIIYGYGESRAVYGELYASPEWLHTVAVLLMIPVFPLILAAYLPGRIRTAVGHPMLTGTIIWGAAHLLANGGIADIILFGSLLLWSIADRLSLARRPGRPVPAAPPSPVNDIIAVVLGLALYLLMTFRLHELLFGVEIY